MRFETGVVIGEDISARYLRGSFDVILLTMGAGHPRDLPVPGRELDGIHYAMDFLTRSNQFQAGEIPADQSSSPQRTRSCWSSGGGDTGSDCVGTAIRMGAREVHQFEIMPRPPDWKEAWNPSWPAWPNILRTSSSQEEGCARDWSITTHKFTGENGRVARAALCARGVEEGRERRPDEDGRGRRFRVLPQGGPRPPGHGIRARDARQDHGGAGGRVRPARQHPLQPRLFHVGRRAYLPPGTPTRAPPWWSAPSSTAAKRPGTSTTT